MRYLSFLIITIASYSLVTWILEDKTFLEKRENEKIAPLTWPGHWYRDGEMLKGVKFISFYSKNDPKKELPICLKHFKALGYDADGMGLERTQSAIMRVSNSVARLTINIMPDEQGTDGSSITVQILPKPTRKENL